MSHPRRQTRTHDRRAFTLLELLIVMGIIAVLAGLVLSVSHAVLRNAEKRQVVTAFSALDQAVQEFERAREQKLTYKRISDAAGTYDITEQSINSPYLIVPVLALLNSNERCREILKRIDADLLRNDVSSPPVPPVSTVPLPRMELVDPWGNRIAVVFPGRAYLPSDTGTKDADGTVRTTDENSLGVCRDRRICFISAGPDGNFGTREDNIYSYDLLPPN